jgi:PKD repeat protein
VVLLVAGCADQTEADNQTTIVPIIVHTVTLAPSVILTDPAIPSLNSSPTWTNLPVTTTSQHISESTLANANELAADFYPSSNEGFTPYTVGFIDTSSGLPTSWHWDFDDGTFSDERSPIHTFYNATEPNTLKTVTLTIRKGTAISTKSVDLLIHPPYPFPDFEASSLNGTAPLTVYFTDTSFGVPGANEWVFGDGFISYESHPHHTYKNPGVYEVKLIISTPMATRSKNATITVR